MLQSIAKNYTLLYVEDDAIIRKETSEFFRNFFKEVIVAENGEIGLSLFDTYMSKNSCFNIVVSDIQMPIMDGIALSRKIIDKKASQKIVIISAHNETEYFIDLINIGISSFIQKPLKVLDMIETLYNVCLELTREDENAQYIELADGIKWDTQMKKLIQNNTILELTSNEMLVIDLLVSNLGQIFTSVDIFNHIHFKNFEKEFSADSIKSLLKRLRQKINTPLIQTHKNLGFSISS